MKKFFFASVFVLFTLVVCSASAHAATYYVSPGESLTGAMSQLRAGDTLYLHAGTYSEGISLLSTNIASGSSWSNPVTISAAPGEKVTLRGVGLYTHDANGSPQYIVSKILR